MTDARLGGLGREALVSSVGEARLGGLAREALVNGVGLSGRLAARSYAQGASTVTYASTPVLRGTAGALSSTRGSLTLTVALAGRLNAQTRLGLLQLPTALDLGGRIDARSSAVLVERTTRVLQAKVSAASRARGLLGQRALGPQTAVTLNV